MRSGWARRSAIKRSIAPGRSTHLRSSSRSRSSHRSSRDQSNCNGRHCPCRYMRIRSPGCTLSMTSGACSLAVDGSSMTAPGTVSKDSMSSATWATSWSLCPGGRSPDLDSRSVCTRRTMSPAAARVASRSDCRSCASSLSIAQAKRDASAPVSSARLSIRLRARPSMRARSPCGTVSTAKASRSKKRHTGWSKPSTIAPSVKAIRSKLDFNRLSSSLTSGGRPASCVMWTYSLAIIAASCGSSAGLDATSAELGDAVADTSNRDARKWSGWVGCSNPACWVRCSNPACWVEVASSSRPCIVLSSDGTRMRVRKRLKFCGGAV